MADARRKLEPNRRELLGGVVVLTILAGVIVTRQGMPQSSLATPVALHPLAETWRASRAFADQSPFASAQRYCHPCGCCTAATLLQQKKPQATRDQARSSQ